jgi:hypothetical protein
MSFISVLVLYEFQEQYVMIHRLVLALVTRMKRDPLTQASEDMFAPDMGLRPLSPNEAMRPSGTLFHEQISRSSMSSRAPDTTSISGMSIISEDDVVMRPKRPSRAPSKVQRSSRGELGLSELAEIDVSDEEDQVIEPRRRSREYENHPRHSGGGEYIPSSGNRRSGEFETRAVQRRSSLVGTPQPSDQRYSGEFIARAEETVVASQPKIKKKKKKQTSQSSLGEGHAELIDDDLMLSDDNTSEGTGELPSYLQIDPE